MARSRLIDPANDLITDGGAVLWSFIQGEQLEFPITLGFVDNILITDAIVNNPSYGYIVEAKVFEADNLANQTSRPTSVKSGGMVTPIKVRIPYYKGSWTSGIVCIREDVVLYNQIYYKCLISGQSNTAPPDDSSRWAVTQANKIYIQYPDKLGNNWATKDFLNVTTAIYGFFELRVTEPVSSGTYSLGQAAFRKTWKPIRGMVELLYSPTYSSDDLTAQDYTLELLDTVKGSITFSRVVTSLRTFTDNSSAASQPTRTTTTARTFTDNSSAASQPAITTTRTFTDNSSAASQPAIITTRTFTDSSSATETVTTSNYQ